MKSEDQVLAFPGPKPLRARLRAIASDLVASWLTSGGVPPQARSRRGLEAVAGDICRRAGTGQEHVGWTMVAIVSEFWRERLAACRRGAKLVLLPDCPASQDVDRQRRAGVPATCGPACDVGTVWSAARDSGWTVLGSSEAISAIGGLLTRQYEGVLGIAKLPDLQKAFAMMPCFSVPIAAIPIRGGLQDDDQSVHRVSAEGGGCPCGVDVDTALGFLGVATGEAAPVADYLPTLREAAEMFEPAALASLLRSVGVADGRAAGSANSSASRSSGDETGMEHGPAWGPLDAAAGLSLEFLGRGGKFLRPFITLAAYDAVVADTARAAASRPAARTAAVAIEIFHKASLVHDDIEDDDAMRYGVPTMHRRHGVPSAINAGDYLLGLGYRLIGSIEGETGLSRDLLSLLSDAHLRLAQGQGAELWWRDAGDKRLSVEESLAIYGLKTSPAFEAAVAMGIRLAGCRPEDVGPIRRYALHVGTAFQILNDLKDWSGDAENQRRAAGDLLGGRPTVMLAVALERLPPKDAERLLAVATAGSRMEADPVAMAGRLFVEADVFGRVRQLVDRERRQAVAAVSSCRLPRLREVLEFLLDLAVPEHASSVEFSQPQAGDAFPRDRRSASEGR